MPSLPPPLPLPIPCPLNNHIPDPEQLRAAPRVPAIPGPNRHHAIPAAASRGRRARRQPCPAARATVEQTEHAYSRPEAAGGGELDVVDAGGYG